VVAGSLTYEILRNEFLCTKEEYTDFELRLQARSSREDANGGIQFRWGALYDESRRRERLAVGEQEGLAKVFRPLEWNDYAIRAEGTHVGIWINGFQTVDYTETDADIELTGVICLQVHSGPPAEIGYRNIEIQTLGGAAPEDAPAPAGAGE
jgi:hypothetical protein